MEFKFPKPGRVMNKKNFTPENFIVCIDRKTHEEIVKIANDKTLSCKQVAIALLSSAISDYKKGKVRRK